MLLALSKQSNVDCDVGSFTLLYWQQFPVAQSNAGLVLLVIWPGQSPPGTIAVHTQEHKENADFQLVQVQIGVQQA